jgi:hypothetical protein
MNILFIRLGIILMLGFLVTMPVEAKGVDDKDYVCALMTDDSIKCVHRKTNTIWYMSPYIFLTPQAIRIHV